MKRLLSAFACAVVLAALACGGTSPSAPSTPTFASVAGVWTGPVTQTGASAGPECLGLFQSQSSVNGAGREFN